MNEDYWKGGNCTSFFFLGGGEGGAFVRTCKLKKDYRAFVPSLLW